MKHLLCLTLTALLIAGPSLLSMNAAMAAEVQVAQALQDRLGIETAPMEPRLIAETVRGYARVLDASPLAALDADVVATSVATAAARSEAERLAGLAAIDQGASQRSLEAARAEALADQARLSLARRRLSLEWGPAISAMSDEDRAQLLEQIAHARAALLRIDPLAPPEGEVRHASIRVDEADLWLDGDLLGIASAADPRLQSTGYLTVLRGSGLTAVRAGRVFAATLATDRQMTGVLVPRAAVVRTNGAAWVWIRQSVDHFERRRIEPVLRAEEGWFVTTGLRSGDAVVVSGAEALLSLEQGAAEVEDD